MAHRYVSSAPDLLAAPSPISQAVVAGNHCYVSGQLSVDSTGTFRPGTAREEATQAFANVFAALRAAGFSREDIVYVDVAFIDVGLPDRSGIEVARELRARWPSLRVAIATGYGEQARSRVQRDAQTTFLSKPFDTADVAAALRSLGLDASSLAE